MNKQNARKELIALEKKKKELQDIIDLPENLFTEIENYSDVCLKLGESEVTKDDFSEDFNDETLLKLIAFAKIKQIERLFNGTWVKDWNNRSQEKHYPYFDNTTSGLVLGG